MTHDPSRAEHEATGSPRVSHGDRGNGGNLGSCRWRKHGEPGNLAVDTLAWQSVTERIAAEVVELVRRRKSAPRATYRCQFHNGFGFRDAAAIVPYLESLGISHIYTSPVWRARPGSTHGYDVCSHQEFDPELGGEAGWNDFRAVLDEHHVGVLLDVVPNHMSTHAQNLWWNDILENGPSSPFARYFDIDWRPVKPELDGRIMLPVLGRQYGDALEEGELSVAFDAGSLLLRYSIGCCRWIRRRRR